MTSNDPAIEELARIFMHAADDLPTPFPKGTPEDEQSVGPWIEYHQGVERRAIRAIYDAGWADGFNKATVSCEELTFSVDDVRRIIRRRAIMLRERAQRIEGSKGDSVRRVTHNQIADLLDRYAKRFPHLAGDIAEPDDNFAEFPSVSPATAWDEGFNIGADWQMLYSRGERGPAQKLLDDNPNPYRSPATTKGNADE